MGRLRTSVTAAVAAGLVLGALASPAAARPPAAGYEQFSGCPEQADMYICVRAVISGGHLQLGNTDTPITEEIVLNGGVPLNATGMVFTPVGGMTSPRQRVPGGLTGLTGLDWLADLFPLDTLKVYARAQLAGAPSDPSVNPFRLPLKIKLENPLLSGNCYIGSDSNPVVLNLTTGTTSPPPPAQPISGVPPTPSENPNYPGTVFDLTGGKQVDNAFAAPGAHGCTLLLPGIGLIDAAINLRSGLPSAAGRNEAEFDFDAQIADPLAVYPPAS